MFEHYRLTDLELFVEDLYIQNRIVEPKQITITELSSRLNVWVHYVKARSRAVESETGIWSIFIDKRISSEKKRMDFLHELSHLLLHVGNQMVLPALFTQSQENEAINFMYYAAIPFFMLKSMPIPANRQQTVEYISYTFDVTLKFAERRLAQIERRELQGQLDVVTSSYITSQWDQPIDPMPTDGTSIYAFYDSSADITGPSQLVIEADNVDVESATDFLFSVDGPFNRLELEDIHNYSQYKRLFAQDLIYKDGQIGVNFSVLNIKYGRTQRYVLHMKDIEYVVETGKFF